MLDTPVALGRNFRLAAASTNFITNGVAALALVSKHYLWVRIVSCHQIVECGAVERFAWCQYKGDGKTMSVGSGVDFG
jgi:hypothetical protein